MITSSEPRNESNDTFSFSFLELIELGQRCFLSQLFFSDTQARLRAHVHIILAPSSLGLGCRVILSFFFGT